MRARNACIQISLAASRPEEATTPHRALNPARSPAGTLFHEAPSENSISAGAAETVPAGAADRPRVASGGGHGIQATPGPQPPAGRPGPGPARPPDDQQACRAAGPATGRAARMQPGSASGRDFGALAAPNFWLSHGHRGLIRPPGTSIVVTMTARRTEEVLDMATVDSWLVEIFLRERDRETHAEARLTRGGGGLSGQGTARRNPEDREATQIGEEIAAARALSDLAHKLLDTAAGDIEAITHHRARLHL